MNLIILFVLVECPSGSHLSFDGHSCVSNYKLTSFDESLTAADKQLHNFKYNNHLVETGVILPTDSNEELSTKRICTMQFNHDINQTECVCDPGYELDSDKYICKGEFCKKMFNTKF